MTFVHHLLKEDDFKEKCAYCGSELNEEEWKEIHDSRIQYHNITCECGKRNTIRIDSKDVNHNKWAQDEFMKRKTTEKERLGRLIKLENLTGDAHKHIAEKIIESRSKEPKD